MAKKVLIIDDDRNIVKYLSVALSKSGYEPIGAHDGKEGLEKVSEFHPDLIVLDIMMPKKTGLVVFRQLRSHDEYKSIPVIMLTSIADVMDENEAVADAEPEYEGLREVLRKAIRKMRDDGLEKPELFVDKPADPLELVESVRGLIGA